MNHVTFFPQGDRAITISFGEIIQKNIHLQVKNLSIYLEANPFPGMLEVTPSYTTVTIFYDPTKITRSTSKDNVYKVVENKLKSILSTLPSTYEEKANIVTIPVCYGGDHGPDLQYVASYHNLTEQEVIDIHSKQEYLVYMIGFAPGFPYLGGMSKKIATPRKETPRVHISEGSIGIGGEQTGIYPIKSPGGWQLIGRTPVTLFNPKAEEPTLLRAGDIIRFEPITTEQYDKWEGDS